MKVVKRLEKIKKEFAALAGSYAVPTVVANYNFERSKHDVGKKVL